MKAQPMFTRWVSRWLSQQQINTPRPLPRILIRATFNYNLSLIAPNGDINAAIINDSGILVGRASYGISPLHDCVYFFSITIAQDFKRQGYGMALLVDLANVYGLPIVPVHQVNSADDFWNAARQFKQPDLQIREPISDSEMRDERKRWAHLQPEIDRLKQVILERIYINHEDPGFAMSRGLED